MYDKANLYLTELVQPHVTGEENIQNIYEINGVSRSLHQRR